MSASKSTRERNERYYNFASIKAAQGEAPSVIRSIQKRLPVRRRNYNLAMAQAHLNVITEKKLRGPKKLYHQVASFARRYNPL